MKNIINSILLAISLLLAYQSNAQTQHYIGIQTSAFPSTFEVAGHTVFTHRRYGLMYQYQTGGRLSIKATFSWADKEVKDDGDVGLLKEISSGFYGDLSMKERLGIAGITYNLNPSSKVNCIIGADFFAGRYYSSGIYGGRGFIPESYTFERDWRAYGLIFKGGAQYKLANHFLFQATTNFQLAQYHQKESPSKTSYNKWIPLELALSYGF